MKIQKTIFYILMFFTFTRNAYFISVFARSNPCPLWLRQSGNPVGKQIRNTSFPSCYNYFWLIYAGNFKIFF